MTDPLIIEAVLNEKVSYGFEAGPQFNNVKSVLKTTGKVRVRINWDQPLRRFRSLHRRFNPELFEELLSTFIVAQGDAYAFLMKDWTDFRVTQHLLPVAPTGTDAVQLTRTYAFGGLTKTRKILRPKASTIVVEEGVAGVWTPKAGIVAATTGIFTPSVAWAPGAEVRWTGEFYVIVRFADDYMPATYEDFRAISTPLQLVEYLPQDYTP